MALQPDSGLAVTHEYKQRIEDAILRDDGLLRAVFSGQRAGWPLPWIKVVVRPVLIKGTRHLQFAYYDAAKCITKNYAPADVAEHLASLLDCGFKNMHITTRTGTLQVQFTKKGTALVHRGKAQAAPQEPNLAHDRRKRLVLPADAPDPFLHAVGIMTKDGKVRAEQQRKFRQINEFLKIVDETVSHATRAGLDLAQVNAVDCGCGNAYLTFATYHYFTHVRHVPTQMVGIDVNAEPLTRHVGTARLLGWEHLTFHTGRIVTYEPPRTPTLLLSLHACDTATDEALAQAIKWHIPLIFSVPCCHYHLQQQLDDHPTVAPFGPVMRHGVLSERLGDILTDTFRALTLRIMGYQTDVLQFVSTEHTAKNVMIRAVKRLVPGDAHAVREYDELKRFWHVTPYLEQLLGEELATALGT